jgi:hypothetical protein
MDLIHALAALVRLAARRAPPRLRERLVEEWRAHLNDTPDKFGKLLLALDLIRASRKLRRDSEDVDAEQNASGATADDEVLDRMRQVISDRAPAGLAVSLGAVSGWDALGYEFLEEQAATIGRLARELRDALDALDRHDKLNGRARGAPAAADYPSLQGVRAHLVDTAAYALWHFVVQRECMGLRVTEEILEDYAVPIGVRAKMGAVGHPAR